MAGQFDPQDIRSEMAGGTQPLTSSPSLSPPQRPATEIILRGDDPVPLEMIPPGAPGNEIDVENLPDFEVLNKAFPTIPLRRTSKRQAGFEPDFTASKKPRYPNVPRVVLDTDFPSDDDSEDGDFELVARPKKAPIFPTSSAKASSSQPVSVSAKASVSVLPFSTINDEEESLASMLLRLKKTKGKATSVPPVVDCEKEMERDYQLHKEAAAQGSHSPSNYSKTDSAASTESDKSYNQEATEEIGSADSTSAGDSVANSQDNTGYNTDSPATGNDPVAPSGITVSEAYSRVFYSSDVLALWPLYVHRTFIEERNIDVDNYTRQNLIIFLKARRLYSTVTTVVPYCRAPVLEFYANLSPQYLDEETGRVIQVYLRGGVMYFSTEIINGLYDTPDETEEDLAPDIHSITYVITGGRVTRFPDLPDRLLASSLTSFYSVLHKISVHNWTPSSNTTNVTRPQAHWLYIIGTGGRFNFGQMVFNTIMQFADGGAKATKLPFPSLIYCLLKLQGFVKDINEQLVKPGESLKIAPQLLRGNRLLDLPWTENVVAPSIVPSVDNTSDHTIDQMSTQANIHVQPPIYSAPLPPDFMAQQISYHRERAAYHLAKAAEFERMLHSSGPSGQKGEMMVCAKTKSTEVDIFIHSGGVEVFDKGGEILFLNTYISHLFKLSLHIYILLIVLSRKAKRGRLKDMGG